MLLPHQIIYRGNAAATGEIHSQFFARALAGGQIVRIDFEVDGVTDFSGDWYFGLEVNGTEVLTGAERPYLQDTDLAPYVGGLTEAVTQGDILTPTINARGGGVINGPIVCTIWIQATGKATPASGDIFGFSDSADSYKIKTLTFAQLQAAIGGGGGGATALDDLTDVDVPIPSDGKVLVYNQTTGMWEAGLTIGNPLVNAMLWLNAASGESWLGDINGNGNDTYILVDDTNAVIVVSKVIEGVTPTAPNHLATKAYVDSVGGGGGSYTDEQAQDAVGLILDDSGDIDFTYDDATPKITGAVKNSAVTLAKMANIADGRFLGNNTGSSAAPVELTGAQATALLNTFTNLLKGLVPASGGGTTNFLRADGSWAVPPGTGGGGGGGGIIYTEVTGTSQSAAVNSGYITNNAALVTVTLPSTAAVGDRVIIQGSGAGGWKLAQNASQEIKWMSGGTDGVSETTAGTGGYLASTDRYDSVELICIGTDNTWSVVRAKGNITIV